MLTRFLTISLAAGVLLLPSPSPAELLVGQTRAFDGETIVFSDEVIVLYGIDTLEPGQTCSRRGVAWACGLEAKKALASALRQGLPDCRPMGRDQGNRMLAICQVDGRDLGEQLVIAGLAVSTVQAYAADQDKAHAAGAGMWSGSFQTPSQYRAQHPDLELSRPKPPRRPALVWVLTSAPPKVTEYRNCSEARLAGAAPLLRGRPGYRPALDLDGDGVACKS